MILPGVNLLFEASDARGIGANHDKQILRVESQLLILNDDLDVR